MHKLLILALLLAQSRLPFRATRTGFSGGTETIPPEWTDHTAVIAEPTPPTLSRGQRYTNQFGNAVVRLTDANTIPGLRFSPYYVDRSALNSDSSRVMLVSNFGSWWIQDLDTAGNPVGAIYNIGEVSGAPSLSGAGFWHPTDPDVYLVASGTALWRFNAASKTWALLHSFAGQLPITDPSYPGGAYLQLQGISPSGTRVWFDFRTQAKVAWGVVDYIIPTNTVKWSPGRRMTDGHPDANSTFASAGVGAVDKSGEYIVIQEVGSPIPGDFTPYGLSNTYSYVVPTSATNLMGTGYSISGDFPAYHGAMLSRGQVRTESFAHGYYERLNTTTGGPDYFLSVRYADFTGSRLPAGPPDYGAYPYRDVFLWPLSSGMTGVHMSANGAGDKWVVLSLYQEAAGARVSKALAHEIIMVDTTVPIGTTAVGDAPGHIVLNTNGRIRRIGNHHSDGSAGPDSPLYYNGQPHATLSLDHKWIVFGSSWGQTTRYDAFMVRVPASLQW